MKSKDADIRQQEKETIRARDKVPEDFMPFWSKEEDCFKAAIITDVDTKKKTTDTFPRPVPMNQLTYENWLEKTVNPSTGEYYPQRSQEGTPIKGTGAKYVIKVITRIKAGKNEYLCTKGNLMGFSAAGDFERLWITYPEKWTKTSFTWKRVIDEKTRTFDTECQGPSGTEDVYELGFSPENVDKLYERAD